MLNKKRQELIIQNLKSISSQVRAMSIEQLVNLPSLPAQEKIKLIEPCLQDSEETVKTAAKIALEKLGSKGSGSVAMPSSSATTFSSTPSKSPSSVAGGFELPPLNDIPSESNFNLPNLFDNSSSKPLDNAEPESGAGFSLPGLNQVSQSVSTLKPANPIPTPVTSSPNSVAPIPTSVASSPTPTAPIPTPAAASPTPAAPMPTLVASSLTPSTPIPTPTASMATPVHTSYATSTGGTVLIDGPVDASLPVIQNSTDIVFLLQHIREIASSKPSGYLTRLFELCKSVHEEVALTALQTLYNQKDDRVAPEIMILLNNTSYSSQRRFLMLKIVMDTNVPLNADFLENILVNEKDVIIKSGLVKVFARNCSQDGVPLLIRCLKDEDPRVRANTVEVIESQHITGCEKEIIKMLDDSENRVKVNAAKYLVKIGYHQAFLTLRNMLVSPEVWLRDSVIFALGEIGDQSSIVLLRAALKDPNQGIRLSVLKSLAKINTAMARQILKAATNDPDQVVAQVAISLFERIKDTPVREDSAPNVSGQPVQNKPSPVQASQKQNIASPLPSMPSLGGAPSQAAPSSPLPSMPSLGSAPSQAAPSSPLPSMSSLGGAPSQVAPASPLPSMPSFGGAPSQVSPASPLPSMPSLGGAPSQAAPSSPLPPIPSLGGAPSQTPGFQKPQVTVTKPLSGSLSGITGQTRPSVPMGSARPLRPVAATGMPRPQTSNPPAAPSLPAGSPTFSKPRSAAIYSKLCSTSVEEQRSGMKDIAFVMGNDQMILLEKAISLEDESIRIAAVKILSRRRTPDVKAILSRLTGDSNETIASMAKKSLMLMK